MKIPGQKSSCCSLDKEAFLLRGKACTRFQKPPVIRITAARIPANFLKISDSFQPGIEKVPLKPFTVASTLLFFDIPG